jgi:hypothetical protein
VKQSSIVKADRLNRRKIRKQLKMSSSKKIYLSCNFVGSESGQIQSVKLLQNMVSNRTQNAPPPPTATHCLYILYFEGGGEVNQREG